MLDTGPTPTLKSLLVYLLLGACLFYMWVGIQLISFGYAEQVQGPSIPDVSGSISGYTDHLTAVDASSSLESEGGTGTPLDFAMLWAFKIFALPAL